LTAMKGRAMASERTAEGANEALHKSPPDWHYIAQYERDQKRELERLLNEALEAIAEHRSKWDAVRSGEADADLVDNALYQVAKRIDVDLKANWEPGPTVECGVTSPTGKPCRLEAGHCGSHREGYDSGPFWDQRIRQQLSPDPKRRVIDGPTGVEYEDTGEYRAPRDGEHYLISERVVGTSNGDREVFNKPERILRQLSPEDSA